jgi:hypothetical protein
LSKQVFLSAGAVVVAFLAFAAGSASSAVGSAASTQSYVIKAALDTKQQVPAPKDASAAKGLLKGTLTLAGKKSSFVFHLSFSGLSGRAVAANVGIATPGEVGAVVLPLCTKCVPNAKGVYQGLYVAKSAFLKPLLQGRMYVSVVTKLNPKGEIRGQIKATSS